MSSTEYNGSMKAVFFDLDGTLLDTLPDIRNAINYALRAYDGEEASSADVRRYVGRGLYRALSSAAAEKNPKGLDENEFNLMFALMKNYYSRHAVVETKPYPGIAELLHSLKRKGIRLGIVSNKADSIVKEIIGELLPDIFDFVSGEREGYPLKPDPKLLLDGIEAVGSSPAETVYVGDSEVDAETGKRAGIRTVIVSYGFRSREELGRNGIETSADNAEELAERLERMV